MSYSIWHTIQCGVDLHIQGYTIRKEVCFNVETDEYEPFIGLYVGTTDPHEYELERMFNFNEKGADEAFKTMAQLVEGDDY